MAVTSKWRRHIERWQGSGLPQAEYCGRHGIDVRTFAARLSDSRKRPAAVSELVLP